MTKTIGGIVSGGSLVVKRPQKKLSRTLALSDATAAGVRTKLQCRTYRIHSLYGGSGRLGWLRVRVPGT